jgi:hypothetical protein
MPLVFHTWDITKVGLGPYLTVRMGCISHVAGGEPFETTPFFLYFPIDNSLGVFA